MEEEEDINLSPWQKIGIVGVLCLLIGFSVGYGLQKQRRYRTPPELADYVEGMLFNESHRRDIQHPQIKAILDNPDLQTLGHIKYIYQTYHPASRSLLESQLNILCYTSIWK